MAVDKKRKKKTDEKPINEELIDELLADYKKPEDVIGENGLLKRLTKALLQRAMNAELADHLGYRKHDPVGYNSGNSRNGGTSKTLKGDFGEIALETPRDRNGTFEPKIVAKGQTRFTCFDDMILSMYARGMTTPSRLPRDVLGAAGDQEDHPAEFRRRATAFGCVENRCLRHT